MAAHCVCVLIFVLIVHFILKVEVLHLNGTEEAIQVNNGYGSSATSPTKQTTSQNRLNDARKREGEQLPSRSRRSYSRRNVPPCSSSPCKHGGICEPNPFNASLDFRCACPFGRKGKLCDEMMLDCSAMDCDSITECMATTEGSVCICSSPDQQVFCYSTNKNDNSSENTESVFKTSKQTVLYKEDSSDNLPILLGLGVIMVIVIITINCLYVVAERQEYMEIYNELRKKDGVTVKVKPPSMLQVQGKMMSFCCGSRNPTLPGLAKYAAYVKTGVIENDNEVQSIGPLDQQIQQLHSRESHLNQGEERNHQYYENTSNPNSHWPRPYSYEMTSLQIQRPYVQSPKQQQHSKHKKRHHRRHRHYSPCRLHDADHAQYYCYYDSDGFNENSAKRHLLEESNCGHQDDCTCTCPPTYSMDGTKSGILKRYEGSNNKSHVYKGHRKVKKSVNFAENEASTSACCVDFSQESEDDGVDDMANESKRTFRKQRYYDR